MPYNKQFSAHGIVEVGEFTGAKGGTYVEKPWGLTTQEGAQLSGSVSSVKQRSGQSASVIDSFISEFEAQLRVGLISATLDNIRRLYGLPTTALTGDLSATPDPTEEVLTVKGSELGTQEVGIYVRTMGPVGPRTYYVPRCKVSSLPELNMSRTGYTEPTATFDVYENEDGELYWIEDAVA